jgi:hypothetical protein
VEWNGLFANAQTQLGTSLPGIFAALLSALFGGLMATVLRELARSLFSASVAMAAHRAGMHSTVQLSTLVFILVFIPSLIAVLDALRIGTISCPVPGMLASVLQRGTGAGGGGRDSDGHLVHRQVRRRLGAGPAARAHGAALRRHHHVARELDGGFEHRRAGRHAARGHRRRLTVIAGGRPSGAVLRHAVGRLDGGQPARPDTGARRGDDTHPPQR